MIPHQDLCILRFELWVASNNWLVPFNSPAPVVTKFVVKNRKKSNFLKFTISLLVNIVWM